MASFMRRNAITLGGLQRGLTAVSDCTTSVYNFLFSLFVLLYFFKKKGSYVNENHYPPQNTVSGERKYDGVESTIILSYLVVWVSGEGIGCASTLIVRFYALCRNVAGNKKQLEKLLFFKFLAFMHYFLVLCGTAGFLGEWTQNSSAVSDHKHNVLEEMRLVLFIGQILVWTCVVSLMCMIFSLYWSITDTKSLRDAQSFWAAFGLDEVYNICCLPIVGLLIPVLNQIYRVIFCPFYFVGHLFPSSETYKRILYLPITIAINVVTIPIRVIAFIAALGAQAIGWAVMVGTLGLPLCLLPTNVTDILVNVRNALWQNHPLKYWPAVIPLTIFLVMSTYGILVSLYILFWLCIFAWCCNCDCASRLLMFIASFCRMSFDTIVGSRNGLGVRYDAMIALIPLSLLLLLLDVVVSSMVLQQISPNTIVSATKSLIDTPDSTFSKLWVACKIIQFSVSTLLPIIRLFALGKLNRLRSLLAEYPKYQLLLYIVSVLELTLIDLDDDNNTQRTSEAPVAQDRYSTGPAAPTSTSGGGGSGAVVTVYQQAAAPQAVRYNSPRDELLVMVDDFRVKLHQITLAMEEEINDIAYILFDYDFSQSRNGDGNDHNDNNESENVEVPVAAKVDIPNPLAKGPTWI